MTGQLLTARTVAGMLDVSAETVLRWIRRGEMPAIRLPGGAIRIRETELDAWLTDRATPGRGVRPTTTGAAHDGRYRAGDPRSLPGSTDADTNGHEVRSLVRPTTLRTAAAPEDEES